MQEIKDTLKEIETLMLEDIEIKQKKMKIEKKWCMPDSRTFRIKPIKDLILKYKPFNGVILDPFANEMSIKQYFLDNQFLKYISNDLDTDYETDYNLEAQDFLKMWDDNSVDLVLYDPPYSGRQVSECYKKLNKTVTMSDTNSGYYVKFKEEISRIVKKGGIVISLGWSSNGIGKKYGFEQIEILLVAHGGNHNDTIVTVERKL